MKSAAFITVAIIVGVAATASAAVSFNISYVDDASGTFSSRGWLDPNSLFQQDIRAGLDEWGRQFNSDATLVVRVDTTSYAARAGGSFTYGRFLSNNAQGKEVWEVGSLTRMLTGSNPGESNYGYDIVLGFDASFVEQYYWFDPMPRKRTDAVPADQGDFVTVVMHEMGHALGIGGNRELSGAVERPDISQFDNLSYFGGDGNPFDAQGDPNPMFFGGDHAADIYGADLPLIHKATGDPNYLQNFYHLGAYNIAAPDGLESTLMNGAVLPNGQRLYLTSIDRAVIADLGYPMAARQPGDFNADGLVNAADLFQWNAARGTAGADANLDGHTDGADFLLWQRHAAGSAIAATTAVPEPVTAVFAVMAVTCSLHIRLRRRPLQ